MLLWLQAFADAIKEKESRVKWKKRQAPEPVEELEELDSDEMNELEEIDMISEPGGSKEKCDDNLSRMKNIYKNIQSNIKEDEYYCVDYDAQFYIGRV